MSSSQRTIPLTAPLEGFFRTCLLLLVMGPMAVAEPPAFDEAIGSWLTARDWLDEGTLPDPASPEARLSVGSLAGVSVVLRLDGRTVGRASAFADDEVLIRRTIARALSQALGDETLKNLPEAVRDRAAERLALEIEFAGAPEPLLGTQLGTAVARIQPGIDGIAMRRKDEWAHAFPGRAVATGTAGNVTSTILRLAGDLGLPPRDLPELRAIDDIGLYRFTTLRIAQGAPTTLPFEAQRSGKVVARSDLDRDARRAFAEELIAHLNTHRPGEEEREQGAPAYLGDFDPVADRHEPMAAPPLERALVAWALAEASRCEAIGAEARTMAADDAHHLLASLQEIDLETPDLALDVTALAAAALVKCDGENDPLAVATLNRIAPVLLEAASAQESAPRIHHAAALASIPECVVPEATTDAVGRLLARAWANATPEILVANLDWFALAEVAFARRNGAPEARIGLLRETRDVLAARRATAPLGNDLDGGIPLQSAAINRIDARALRIAIACVVLAEVEPPEGRDAAQDTIDGLVRFASQLQVRKEDARLYRGGLRAIGGIREAPWSPRQPLAAEAMALLLVSRTLCQ